jgi:hypothetical protein
MNYNFKGVFLFIAIILMIAGYFIVKGLAWVFNHIHFS